MEIKLNLEDVAEFVTIVSVFESDVNVRSVHNGVFVDAKSIMSVIGLDLGGTLITDINSDDEDEVLIFGEMMRKYEVKNAD